jgi:hypothetical protein
MGVGFAVLKRSIFDLVKRIAPTMFANSALPAFESNALSPAAPNEQETRQGAGMSTADRALLSIDLSCLDRLLAEISRHRETLRAEQGRLPPSPPAKVAKPRRHTSILSRAAGHGARAAQR